MGASILAGKDRLSLENGMELRLLSALEVLQARREAQELAQNDRERPLCANACLLARALEHDGIPVFHSGQDVLAGLRLEEIAALAQRWSQFNQTENPSLLQSEAQVEKLKKN